MTQTCSVSPAHRPVRWQQDNLLVDFDAGSQARDKTHSSGTHGGRARRSSRLRAQPSCSTHCLTASKRCAQVADPHTVVTINHMRSYEHMGQAGALSHAEQADFSGFEHHYWESCQVAAVIVASAVIVA